jgi:hypothetical protein
MLVLLSTLQHFAAGRGPSIRVSRLRCEFRQPVLIDEPVRFDYRERSDGGIRLEALVDDVLCAELRLDSHSGHRPEPGMSESPPRIDAYLDALDQPLEHGAGELAGFTGAISNAAAVAVPAMFPELCTAVGSSNVAALARLSYVVGMLCPGLYSVFSSLDVTLADQNATKGYCTFAVTSVDDRFRLVEIALRAGDLVGTVRAFQRPPAFQQPTFESLTQRVRTQEFAGARALVIGGSRGLGELTAKLLCAGGGTVHLTYVRGLSEARRVGTEITGSNRGVCTPVELDILAPLSSETLHLLGHVDLIFYFPTPMIFRRKAKTFNATILQDFLRFYVERFNVLCEAVESVAAQPVRIFYPSSTAVDSRPKGMTEYAMAKAAGEVLISDLNAISSKIHIITERLPRMGSDQTNTIVAADEADSAAIMLPILRSMWPF